MLRSLVKGDKPLRRSNPATIHNKFIVGYKGWYACPGDGANTNQHGWSNWITHPLTHGGAPIIDLWPDVSAYTPGELYDVPGLQTSSGQPIKLFSSQNALSVQRHFYWMAEHGVDGILLQRYARLCQTGFEQMRAQYDKVIDNIRAAAEIEGRVFAITYDVSNMDPAMIQSVIERDWIHLIREKQILESASYLRERGSPVVCLAGFGVHGSHHDPATIRAVTAFIRRETPGGAYIIAGSPSHWRTSSVDSDTNPEFLDIWLNEFDAIRPWSVGRYKTEQDADDFAEYVMKEDVNLLNRRNAENDKRHVEYMPVVYPGSSVSNRSQGKWPLNGIPRHGGKFLWTQIVNVKRLGVRVIFGAMWDDYGEGTAFLPAVEKKYLLPKSTSASFLALDAEGNDLPSDWYMRICGFAAEGLRSERMIYDSFPSKELIDYWSSRPKYDDLRDTKAESSSDSSSSLYKSWLAEHKEEKDDLPPPEYSLEASTIMRPPVQTPEQSPQANAVELPVSQSTEGQPSEVSNQVATNTSTLASDQPLHTSGFTPHTSTSLPVFPQRPRPPLHPQSPLNSGPRVHSTPPLPPRHSPSPWGLNATDTNPMVQSTFPSPERPLPGQHQQQTPHHSMTMPTSPMQPGQPIQYHQTSLPSGSWQGGANHPPMPSFMPAPSQFTANSYSQTSYLTSTNQNGGPSGYQQASPPIPPQNQGPQYPQYQPHHQQNHGQFSSYAPYTSPQQMSPPNSSPGGQYFGYNHNYQSGVAPGAPVGYNPQTMYGYQPAQHPYQQNNPGSSSGSNALDFAMTSVQRVAGQDARRKLEQTLAKFGI